METQVTTVKQLPLNEVMSIGKAFAESGMFSDTKSAAQAIVKIQAGQEIGIPPFAAMTGIHIIQGKPTIGAGLIASRVKGSGKYDYRVTQNDEKACIIDFYQGTNKIGTSTFTIEDAKKAGTKNLDKFPKNMLFARCISNGVKWFCPDVFSGPVYVPQEMGADVTEEGEVIVEEVDNLAEAFKTQEEKVIEMIGSMNGDMERITEYYKTLAGELQTEGVVNCIKLIKAATK
jgi:hypothetical protein